MYWLEDKNTLHKNVEITYVVDGYMVSMMNYDGTQCAAEFTAKTLLDAINKAKEVYPFGQSTSKYEH